jgi:ubiquinone/menaquinone biosynthesis C-methylase UbiE
MRNPWLEIPLHDYEGHMALPSIGQAQLLSEQLEAIVRRLQPSSVAVIGCAGGNGFDRIEPGIVRRVVAADINAAYLDETARRYGARFERLEMHCADVQTTALSFEPVDLIYAALLFEYVDAPAALGTMRRFCRRGGTLATILQLPHSEKDAISPSPFTSLQRLSPLMRLVDPADLSRHAAGAGFIPDAPAERLVLPSGKRFHLQTFEARQPPA